MTYTEITHTGDNYTEITHTGDTWTDVNTIGVYKWEVLIHQIITSLKK